uniref:Uncharacterized protein n=1 Tax=Setaria viridis TaxID=4556 RepID=A0A4U6WB75_SETVI|nr:hypothetical protein SEVIR_1G184301v2 [Setaria viridis]
MPDRWCNAASAAAHRHRPTGGQPPPDSGSIPPPPLHRHLDRRHHRPVSTSELPLQPMATGNPTPNPTPNPNSPELKKC